MTTATEAGSGVYRIDRLSGGSTWEFMANSTGLLEPEFMIYSNCDEALAAWSATGDPLGSAMAVPVVLFAWSLLVLLSLSFLLAAAFAVPG